MESVGNHHCCRNLSEAGISKPMVLPTYGVHAGCLSRKRNHEIDDYDSDSYKQEVECWIQRVSNAALANAALVF